MHEMKLRSRIEQELQEHGLRMMEARLQWLQSHSSSPLPYPALSRDETLRIMRDEIENHRKKIVNKTEKK
jgi:hypothetical protein